MSHPRRYKDDRIYIKPDRGWSILYRAIAPDGRLYHGSTELTLAARIANHYQDCKPNRTGHNTKMGKMLRKTPVAEVRWEFLAMIRNDQVSFYEALFIEFFDSFENGLNSTPDGQWMRQGSHGPMSQKRRENIGIGVMTARERATTQQSIQGIV